MGPHFFSIVITCRTFYLLPVSISAPEEGVMSQELDGWIKLKVSGKGSNKLKVRGKAKNL